MRDADDDLDERAPRAHVRSLVEREWRADGNAVRMLLAALGYPAQAPRTEAPATCTYPE